MTRNSGYDEGYNGKGKRSKQVLSVMNQDLPTLPDGNGEQVELLPEEFEDLISQMAGEVQSNKFKFKAMLVLQSEDGVTLPRSVPICSGECVADRIEEILHRGIRSQSFQRILRAILGEPSRDSEINRFLNAKSA